MSAPASPPSRAPLVPDRNGAPRRDPTSARPLLPLVVRGLTHTVGGTRLLDGIDLELGPESGPESGSGSGPDGGSSGRGGGCTAIMGSNGAGKSLLLRLLNGLLVPSGGQILWNGAPPDAAVRRRQSLVFQKPVLLRRSVRANVEFVLKLRPGTTRATRTARADALLALADLASRARAPARRLSGGEQQRLALVCALANAPDVLLLDEPTASLDPASTVAIEDLVADAVASGTRAVLVTHDPGQARRLADSVVFMAGGRVTEHTPGETFFVAPRSPEARDYLAGRLVGAAAPDAVRRGRSAPPSSDTDGIPLTCA